ncbi:hypothetical protein JCM3766R1_006587 [Sporobolomyces carnicolor]
MPTLTQLPDDEGAAAPTSTATPSSATATTADSIKTGTSSEPCRNEPESLGTSNPARHSDGAPHRGEELETEVTWSRQELRDIIAAVNGLKKEGNVQFGRGQWEHAMGTYRQALGDLPPRRTNANQDEGTAPVKGKGRASLDIDEAEIEGTREGLGPGGTANEGAATCEAEDTEITSLRSVLSANVAACLLKLNRWRDAVNACDEALIDQPDYFKALHRRAMANESIGSWSSLSSSLEDFNHLATLPNLTPLLAQQIKLAQARIPKAIKIQQQKEKDEVLGKLKNLGNTVLGKFGFSLDNFKMQEQPGGGYSMSFQQ